MRKPNFLSFALWIFVLYMCFKFPHEGYFSTPRLLSFSSVLIFMNHPWVMSLTERNLETMIKVCESFFRHFWKKPVQPSENYSRKGKALDFHDGAYDIYATINSLFKPPEYLYLIMSDQGCRFYLWKRYVRWDDGTCWPDFPYSSPAS